MSSSNLTRITFIEEAAFGETPATGNFSTARFISESLSGSPETTESAQIRTDRLSSGQIVTSLSVGGSINFELAKESAIDSFLASAMLNTWDTSLAVNADLSIDATARTLTRVAGDWAVDVAVGDIITLSGFTNATNNTQVMVSKITSALIISFLGPTNLVTEVDTGNTFKVADKLTIGTEKVSFSMEKAFLDLTTKAAIYRGMNVSEMSLNIAYGEIVNGSFTFQGNGYETADIAGEFITNTRTIDAVATTQSMNGSIDMPFLGTSSTGDFEEVTTCIQNVTIGLNNNLTTQTCIGRVAPKNMTPGTAAVTVSLSSYLADENWDLLSAKLLQTPFELGFMIKNSGGSYGFYLPAVQVSMSDPASGGQNQDIMMEMDGTASVGSGGRSSLTIFRV